MSTTLSPPPVQHEHASPQTRRESIPPTGKIRSPWRQRLIDAERGMTLGLRNESTMYFHLFSLIIVIASGFVLGLTLSEWVFVVLAVTTVLSTEMFNLALRAMQERVFEDEDPSLDTALRMSTAAVTVAWVGATLAVWLLLAYKVKLLFED